MVYATLQVVALANQAEAARANNTHLERKMNVVEREFQIAKEQHKLRVEEFEEHTTHHHAESVLSSTEVLLI